MLRVVRYSTGWRKPFAHAPPGSLFGRRAVAAFSCLSRRYSCNSHAAPTESSVVGQKPRLHPDEYTVGWISALSIELAAAIDMLDEEHQDVPHSTEDIDIFTFGRMGEHNVVIACLPDGQYGNNQAAAVATRMKARFRSLRFGLLVGVGGGVPGTAADIRLGDVVISKPGVQHSGVVQFDMGKSTPHGFERTGYLNAPPGLLLSALSKLEAQHHRGQSVMPAYLSSISHAKFDRARAGVDRLFKATYFHVGGPTCHDCSEHELEERPPRSSEHAKVHYGLIASGNQVVKDGAHRDDISLKRGGVLCFEMEAAGLMNSFPCLVIRGICDYADSHKNKAWQPHAAATAAACAKEILSLVPAAEVTTINTMRNVMDNANDMRESHKSCWTVPFERNLLFTGYSSLLSRLEDKMFGEEACRRVAITGLGGSGKTQIALELAYEIKEKHPDCNIFWISATSLENFERGYLRIGLHLRVPGIGDENVDVKPLVKEYLGSESSGQWLMILDGADDRNLVLSTEEGASSPHLIDFLPRSDRGVVMATTRDRRVASRFANKHFENMSEMDEQTATELLRRCLIDPEALVDNSAATQTLLQELAYLPLAIVQAAAYINENGQSIREYLSLLEDMGGNIIDILGTSDFDEYGHQKQHAVATTWLLSFKQMQQRQPQAAHSLSFMACLDPWNIPQSLLPPAVSQRHLVDAVNTLVAYSFVTRQPSDPAFDRSCDRGPRFALQKLVHLATRKWMREEGTLAQWTEAAVVRLADVFQTIDLADRRATAVYLPHAQFVLGSGVAHGAAAKETDLRHRVGVCLMVDGNYKEAELMLAEVVDRRRNQSGESDPMTLLSMADLASAYREQGRWKEAESLGKRVLATQREVLGEKNTATLSTMAGLAWTYRKQGRWDEAETNGSKVLDLQRELVGHDHRSTLETAANLARTYRDQGRWSKAQGLAEEVLQARKRLYRKEHPLVLEAITLLASLHRNQGRYAEAESHGVWVLDCQRRVLGDEHPATLDSMASLSRTYREQGRLEEAESRAQQVIAVRRRLLGDEHLRTLSIRFQLAWIYRKQGRLDEAERLARQVVDSDQRVLGKEHPLTLHSLYGLSQTLTLQGRWEEAQNLGEHILEAQKRVLGDEHPWTLENMANIAITYRKQGHLRKAESLAKRVSEMQTRVFGQDHPWLQEGLETLARTLRDMGDRKGAEELGKRVLEARVKVLGGDHPSIKRITGFLAKLDQTGG